MSYLEYIDFCPICGEDLRIEESYSCVGTVYQELSFSKSECVNPKCCAYLCEFYFGNDKKSFVEIMFGENDRRFYFDDLSGEKEFDEIVRESSEQYHKKYFVSGNPIIDLLEVD